jgi:site-specific recombinase XerD
MNTDLLKHRENLELFGAPRVPDPEPVRHLEVVPQGLGEEQEHLFQVDEVRGIPYPKDRHPAAVYIAKLGPNTRRGSMHDLDVIADLVAPGHDRITLPWHELRYEHTAAIRSKLAELYSPGTANKRLSALRGVLKECWRLGYMDAEAYHRAVDLERIKGQSLPRGRALETEEIKELFKACGSWNTSGVRDAAMLAVLYGAGLRRAEVVALNLENVNLSTGELRVIRGKGNKDRIVYLTGGALEAVKMWIQVRGDRPGPLFLPVTKGRYIKFRRLTGQAVLHILKKRAREAGVNHFSPHDMRRTFISDLLDKGADISAVQQLAGHSQVGTTQRYDRRPERIKKAAAELLHIPFHVAQMRLI